MIHVSISKQILYFDGQEPCSKRKQFPVSTGKAGVGQELGSHKTPLGLHVIDEKIGAGCPMGAVFVGRQWTGEVVTPEEGAEDPNRDWILTRILWLSGQQPGLNQGGQVDTKQRYIYIHGTAEEDLIGSPVSHGCIRMRNDDVVQLFDSVWVGCEVHIAP